MSNHPRRQNLAAYWRYIPDWAVTDRGWRTSFYPKAWRRHINQEACDLIQEEG